jgi:protein tyrosine/serine phosphatase
MRVTQIARAGWVLTCVLNAVISAKAQQSAPSPSESTPAASVSTTAPVMRSAYGEKLKLRGLPNGGRVNNFLYRGAQPHDEGLLELKKMGITTIVDLRGEDPQKREWERQRSEALGMRFVNIPISGWDPPSNEELAQFLSIFRNAQQGRQQERVFVHCRFGDDRTGVFVAAYRMAYDHWPALQAMNEMYFFGFNGMWHPSMKSFVRDFPARLKTSPTLSGFNIDATGVSKSPKASTPTPADH